MDIFRGYRGRKLYVQKCGDLERNGTGRTYSVVLHSRTGEIVTVGYGDTPDEAAAMARRTVPGCVVE